MKKSDLDGSDLTKNGSLDFRFLGSASPSEIEAACVYEYMRESQMLRDAINAQTEDERKEKAHGLNTPFFLSFTEEQFFRLMLALQTAGFPKPWKGLSDESSTQLISLVAKSTERTKRRDKKLCPPVIIEEGAAEYDLSENRWRLGQLEPFELSLFRGWEHSGRRYFFGFIRIDCSYNETETDEAFRAWFKNHCRETKGGGSPKWQAKLNDLVVMRLSKRFRDPIKRVEHVAKFTTAGFKGCKEWCDERFKAKRAKLGLVAQQMSKAANEEMSRARADALKFFQSLLPGERPLSY
jgi:hypothetical protein